MAQLKDTVISGSLRATDTIYSNKFIGILDGNASTATALKDAGDTSRSITIQYMGNWGAIDNTNGFAMYQSGTGNLIPIQPSDAKYALGLEPILPESNATLIDFKVGNYAGDTQLLGVNAVVRGSTKPFNGKRVAAIIEQDGIFVYNSTDSKSIWRLTIGSGWITAQVFQNPNDTNYTGASKWNYKILHKANDTYAIGSDIVPVYIQSDGRPAPADNGLYTHGAVQIKYNKTTSAPWPNIRFGQTDNIGTYTSGNITYTAYSTSDAWCIIYGNGFQKQVIGSATPTYQQPYFSFRHFSGNTSDGSSTGHYEDYYLPRVDAGRTSDIAYKIITTKNLSDITSLKLNSITGTDDIGLIGYHQSSWAGGSTTNTLFGPTSGQTIIRSGDYDLLHRKGSTLYTILTANNYSAYALPLTGGNINGDVVISTPSSAASKPYKIYFQLNDNEKMRIGIGSSQTRCGIYDVVRNAWMIMSENGTNTYYNPPCAFVEQTSNTQASIDTNCWYKVASISTSTTNYDQEITFYVYDTYNSNCSGILHARLKTRSPVTGYSEAYLVWEYNNNYSLDDFKLVYNTSGSPAQAELWTALRNKWSGRVFRVMREGDRNESNIMALWTLYTTKTDGSQSAPTNLGGSINSSVLPLRLDIITATDTKAIFGYHQSSWAGGSNTNLLIGALDSQTVIRSNNNDLLHYRNGDASYKIWTAKDFNIRNNYGGTNRMWGIGSKVKSDNERTDLRNTQAELILTNSGLCCWSVANNKIVWEVNFHRFASGLNADQIYNQSYTVSGTSTKGPQDYNWFGILTMPCYLADGGSSTTNQDQPNFSWQLASQLHSNNKLFYRDSGAGSYNNWQQIVHCEATSDVNYDMKIIYDTSTTGPANPKKGYIWLKPIST